ncbi:hypothetical protein Tco_0771212 [Tanacetum coccineum]|uniref:Reverse transcriptase domain-containing protein n=1 Tax=Tanacetum coccineum TaxID=301880 RepID=A0ABQ4ZH01_9ASTR
MKQREEKLIERKQAANLAVQKEQEEQAAQSFTPYWKFPIFDDDDDEYTIQYKEYLETSSKAITPDLSTEELDYSLSMGDEHLDTILETESDEVIKSSVEDLVPIPSESEGIFDNMCDVPSCDKKHFDAESDLMESLLNRDTSIVYSPKIDSLLEKFAGELAPINPIPPGIHEADFDPKGDIRLDDQMFYDDTSSDDDSFEDIDYVESLPPYSELVSIEEVEDDILHAKLSNIYLLITKIESLKDNPTPDCVLKSPSLFPIPVKDSDSFFEKSNTSLSYSDNSLPEFETFSDHTKEMSSGNTTTHADNSLLGYDSFLFEIEPDQGELSSIVIEDILGEPCVHMPNVLPIHPTLMLDSDFIPSDDSLRSNLEVSFPSENRNKIFDPGIFFEVQSKRFLSRDTFSPTYLSLSFEDRHYLSFTYVIRIFLPYFTYPMESLFLLSSRSEDIIFDPGIFAFHFSSLEPVAYECPMEVSSSTCFIPNITMISGESS